MAAMAETAASAAITKAPTTMAVEAVAVATAETEAKAVLPEAEAPVATVATVEKATSVAVEAVVSSPTEQTAQLPLQVAVAASRMRMAPTVAVAAYTSFTSRNRGDSDGQ